MAERWSASGVEVVVAMEVEEGEEEEGGGVTVGGVMQEAEEVEEMVASRMNIHGNGTTCTANSQTQNYTLRQKWVEGHGLKDSRGMGLEAQH